MTLVSEKQRQERSHFLLRQETMLVNLPFKIKTTEGVTMKRKDMKRHQMSDRCDAFGDIYSPENTMELDFSWLLHHTVYWGT